MSEATECRDTEKEAPKLNGSATKKELETTEEHYERIKTLIIVFFTMFLQSLGLAIAMTGIWPYLNQVSFFCDFMDGNFFKLKIHKLLFESFPWTQISSTHQHPKDSLVSLWRQILSVNLSSLQFSASGLTNYRPYVFQLSARW